MKEEARITRNATRLRECNPVFAVRASKIIGRMESLGFRPRIQEAYRSQSDQLAAVRRGSSRVKEGFHNLTSPEGKPDSCAVDVLDDNAPNNPGLQYMLALAWCAKQEKCSTGIDWGCTAHVNRLIAKAIEEQRFDFKIDMHLIGWDPCHVQPADLEREDALRGRRPV